MSYAVRAAYREVDDDDDDDNDDDEDEDARVIVSQVSEQQQQLAIGASLFVIHCVSAPTEVYRILHLMFNGRLNYLF